MKIAPAQDDVSAGQGKKAHKIQAEMFLDPEDN
jgi:hypothetical protein